MIESYKDYLYYLEADKKSLNIKKSRPSLIGDEIWQFQRLLRKTEYYNNCKHSIIYKPYTSFLKFRLYRLGLSLGFTTPINVFGPGLNIVHYGTMIAMGKIGKNCRIHTGVTIGAKAGSTNIFPTIGDNVYIGPGVKISGDIHIADGIAIGANAVVTKSFTEPDITIAGVPAKKISDKGSEGLLIRGTDLILKENH
jgi:serine O-acetyltransferase